jgi:transposase InsO family protein
VIRVDQGSEFVSRDLDLWAYQRGVTLRNTILSLHEHNLYPWPARSELGNQ